MAVKFLYSGETFRSVKMCRKSNGLLFCRWGHFYLCVIVFTYVYIQPFNALLYDARPNEVECFTSYVERDNELSGTFESFYGEDSLQVTVSHKDGTTNQLKTVYESGAMKGEFTFDAKDTGHYILCIQNKLSKPQTVTFNVRIRPDKDEIHPGDIATADEAERLEIGVAGLMSKVDYLMDTQQHSITREAVHRVTAESTNIRVLWWTCAQVFALAVLSGAQLYYMRSFFEVKSIV